MQNKDSIANYYHAYLTKCSPNKYDNLPIGRNSHREWKWEDKDFPRVISLLEFEDYSIKYSFFAKKLLTLNGYNDPELIFIPRKYQLDVDYDKDPYKYDLHVMQLDQKDFDFVLLNQTLEHLYNPFMCLKNINQHMSVGGLLYITVPVLNIPHSTPHHYYTGITPIGLILMLIESGFEIVEAGQWGNADYVHKLFSSKSWPDYRAVSSKNEFDCPVITWALGKKL